MANKKTLHPVRVARGGGKIGWNFYSLSIRDTDDDEDWEKYDTFKTEKEKNGIYCGGL